MIKKNKIKIHPLFLLFGATLFYFKAGGLFWDMLFCWTIQEIGYAIFCCKKGLTVRHWLVTPLGLRGDYVRSEFMPFEQKISIHFIGSGIGILLSVVLFALELRDFARVSLLLAGVRLFPFLPLEGGRIWLEILGKWKGTLRAASWLTKAGCGVGYGLCFIGILFSILFPIAFVAVPVGLYLIYVNKHEFLQIAKDLYFGMLDDTVKPIREVIVTGEETPLELACHLNPYEDIFFFRSNHSGVSQERVMLAVFTGKDRNWIWKLADEKEFGAKIYDFGYDEI
ncbi:hypothetical protein [Anaerotignum sp.]|uniref:hypothetical protein n=1 Tax=Anaerotignum sp. TaxID=2039241 RepID=UPI003321B192